MASHRRLPWHSAISRSSSAFLPFECAGCVCAAQRPAGNLHWRGPPEAASHGCRQILGITNLVALEAGDKRFCPSAQGPAKQRSRSNRPPTDAASSITCQDPAIRPVSSNFERRQFRRTSLMQHLRMRWRCHHQPRFRAMTGMAPWPLTIPDLRQPLGKPPYCAKDCARPFRPSPAAATCPAIALQIPPPAVRIPFAGRCPAPGFFFFLPLRTPGRRPKNAWHPTRHICGNAGADSRSSDQRFAASGFASSAARLSGRLETPRHRLRATTNHVRPEDVPRQSPESTARGPFMAHKIVGICPAGSTRDPQGPALLRYAARPGLNPSGWRTVPGLVTIEAKKHRLRGVTRQSSMSWFSPRRSLPSGCDTLSMPACARARSHPCSPRHDRVPFPGRRQRRAQGEIVEHLTIVEGARVSFEFEIFWRAASVDKRPAAKANHPLPRRQGSGNIDARVTETVIGHRDLRDHGRPARRLDLVLVDAARGRLFLQGHCGLFI